MVLDNGYSTKSLDDNRKITKLHPDNLIAKSRGRTSTTTASLPGNHGYSSQTGLVTTESNDPNLLGFTTSLSTVSHKEKPFNERPMEPCKQATGMTKISRGGYFRPGGVFWFFNSGGYIPPWKNRKFGF